jgi:hypothetical protein
MRSSRLREVAALSALVAIVGLAARPIQAAQSPQPAQAPRAGAPRQSGPAVEVMTVEDPNAGRTRDQFIELLQKYPPPLGRILKLDPSLLTNDAYLAPYPTLVTFLAQHPEVKHNPGYFLDRIQVGYGVGFGDGRDDQFAQTNRLWQNVLDWFGGVAIGAMILSTVGWLIKMLVDYRRWYRLSKVQAEVHNKLLDRLTANDELLAYVQSPAGSRFLQSAPISLDPGIRSIGAPLGRILWSIQVGLVLVAGGVGLQYVSGRVTSDAAQPIFAFGVLGLALGVGFVGSAIVSYVLSRKLGLFEASAPAPSTERRDSTSV